MTVACMTGNKSQDKCIAEHLKRIYIENPCRVLPNAFWKTRDRLPGLRCTVRCAGTQGHEGIEVTELQGWSPDGLELHVLWNQSCQCDAYLQRKLEQANFLIIHNDYVAHSDHDITHHSTPLEKQYRLVRPYFRLKHNHQHIAPYTLPEGFWMRGCNVAADRSEFAAISNFIGLCYRDIHPSPEAVESWIKHAVFDSSLWIWIMDHDFPAALGIAEFDGSVPEGSLEWIQVLPEYQGRGLGKALVLELLSRLKGRADFTTVSGEVDNVTNPERLYRSCGFEGDDVWWLLRR